MQAYALNDEQRQIQTLVRRLARDKVAARAAAIDRSAEYPQDMFDLLREVGLFTIPFPMEYGGTGSMLSAAVAVEELGRVCYNTAYLLIVQWVPFGAILAAGISADTPINRYFRDAKVLQIIEGTNQIQRNIIGESLLGRAAR